MKYFNHIGSVTLKKINTRDISITLGLKNPLAICNYFIDYRNYFCELEDDCSISLHNMPFFVKIGKGFPIEFVFLTNRELRPSTCSFQLQI